MGLSIAEQHYHFECRKCGRKRTYRGCVPWPVSKKEAADKCGYRNTSHGPQCSDGPNGGCEYSFDFPYQLRAIAGREKTLAKDVEPLKHIAKWLEERL